MCNNAHGVCNLADLTPDSLRNTVVRKEELSSVLTLLEISAPLIAQAAKAGQFVIVYMGEGGERIPLTISDSNAEKGTITIIFQKVGKSTLQLGDFKVGDIIEGVVGPLGKPTDVKNYGTVVVIGGGVGTAIAMPVAKAFAAAGNHLITILGAREKSLIILEDEMKASADEFYVTTDDGSYGRKGLVTDELKDLLESRKIDLVFAVGPLPMMKFVSKTTEPYNVQTIVSLDALMIDGTGMCGGCRVTVGGKTMFACVDGPDFDGHKVDWEELALRKRFYFNEEQKAKAKFLGGGEK